MHSAKTQIILHINSLTRSLHWGLCRHQKCLQVDSKNRSDSLDSQTDLSFCLVQLSLCRICYVLTHLQSSPSCCIGELSLSTTKPTKWHMHPAKTQISLDIRPVWSESLLSAWRNLGPLPTRKAHSKDSDKTGQMPRLICLHWAHRLFCWFCRVAAQFTGKVL